MTVAGVEQPDAPRPSRRGSFRFRVPGFSSPPGPFDAPTIDPDELNARRDEMSGEALPLLTAAVGVLLLLSSFFRIQPAESAPGLVGAGICGVVGIVLVIVSIITSRRSPPGSVATAALAVLLVATVALCVAMLASGTLAQTVYIQLLIVVAGPIHGFLYVIYLITTVDLALKVKYSIGRTLLIMLAGTIPFLSFVAEHFVAKDVKARLAGTSPA